MKPTVSHQFGAVTLAGIHRHTCSVCKEPLSGTCWAVSSRARRITHDGHLRTFYMDELWCDKCEKAKR